MKNSGEGENAEEGGSRKINDNNTHANTRARSKKKKHLNSPRAQTHTRSLAEPDSDERAEEKWVD